MKKTGFAFLWLIGVVALFPADLPAPDSTTCIAVTNECTLPSGPDQPVTFAGTVTNCGSNVLYGVTVTNDAGTPDPSDDMDFIVPESLAPGGQANFQGAFVPASTPSTYTVTAWGVDAYEDSKPASASATCGRLDKGCTLTFGYWKTHSKYGPAPYDPVWSLVSPGGEDSVFHLSGKTYFEVLRTSPQGNRYYALAHQFIGAELNLLKGASMPAEVQNALSEARSLFETHTPDQVDSKGFSSLKSSFGALVPVLDGYNMGTSGPGHCN